MSEPDAPRQPGKHALVPAEATSGVSESAPEPVVEAGHRRQLAFWQELILLLSIALVLAVGLKALFLQAFYIPSGSMNDTLVFNDRILVQKVSYWGSAGPSRGDIVVFEDPDHWLPTDESAPARNAVARTLEWFGLYPTGGHLVKRVIGVGGDHVMCCDAKGRLRVNGSPLAETDYLPPSTQPSLETFDVQVPDGSLWVMGDNRSDSADSRAHLGDPGGGYVSMDLVVGKVFSVVWPLGHLTLLHRPATFDDVPDEPKAPGRKSPAVGGARGS